MSGKRFKRISVCGDWGVKDTEKDKVLFFGTTDEVIDTVELLNNLVDENEQLKLKIDGLEYALKNIKRIDVEIDLNE